EEAWKAAIPDLELRANVVTNRLKALAPEHAQELMEHLRSPNAFLAVEALVKATSSKPLALEGATTEGEVTQAKLDEMMSDPKYWREHDRDLIARVEKGFKRI